MDILSFWDSPQTNVASTITVAYDIGRVASCKVAAGQMGAKAGIWVDVKAPFAIKAAGRYDPNFAAAGTSDGIGGYVDNVTLETCRFRRRASDFMVGLGALAALGRRDGKNCATILASPAKWGAARHKPAANDS